MKLRIGLKSNASVTCYGRSEASAHIRLDAMIGCRLAAFTGCCSRF